MNSTALADRLDHAIDAFIFNSDGDALRVDLQVSELLGIAAELRFLPSPDFKAQLKAELEAALAKRDFASQLHIVSRPPAATRADRADVLPTLFGKGYGEYPIHRGSLAASFLAHAAAVVLIASSALWMARPREGITHQVVTVLTEPSPYDLPAAPDKSAGGGGGGDRDQFQASQGHVPRFAREQVTPPTVVVQNETPKLSAEPTVVGPPALTLPQTGPMGDPLSAILGPPSNGVGTGGGIGTGSGDGVGSGHGPGVGPGIGGGIGGGVYSVGGGVSAPRAIYDPDPEYSEEARKAKFQGTVLLWVIIAPDGRPRDIRVQRSLGMGLDQRAIDAVSRWRFEPATKDGRPVAVQVNIEVNFRLF